MNFPTSPTKLPSKAKPLDEISIFSDSSEETSILTSTDSDQSVNDPKNKENFVKCTTAENAFITFVMHGTFRFEFLRAILKSGKINQSVTGIYGHGVYVRVNSAAKWNTPIKDLGPLVAAFGPYYLIFSVAVLDRYKYRVNESLSPKIIKEGDLSSRFDHIAQQWPVRPNNIKIESEVSLAYLQKIWVGPPYTQEMGIQLAQIWPGHQIRGEDPMSVEEIKRQFRKDPDLVKFVNIVEPLPNVIDPTYFIRYCKDWQTPLHQINGAVVRIVDTESEEEITKNVKISKCYIFNDYVQLGI